MYRKSLSKGTTWRCTYFATFNNTLVTISDRSGMVIASSSSGACGFRGARKGTPFVAQTAAEEAALSRLTMV